MKAEILSHLNLTGPYYKLKLYSPHIYKNAMPGQFAMLRVGETSDPLLRRPFSIHKKNPDKTIEILYKIVGKGTRLLSTLVKGKDMDIIGPLGNGFVIDKKIKNHILIAGGIGIAPLLFLAHELSRDKRSRITLFLGARHKEDILCIQNFKRLKARINISTEDGSLGKQGLISELFEVSLADLNEQKIAVYSCGPNNMLREIHRLAAAKGLPCQVSLEARMGCGIGACLGCVVEGKEGYEKVCTDGPVFDAGEVEWGRL
ncbi:MAG: dihydroorotate dehydrogenase electron transfer subunit [Nitrospirae bacterium]|nr:dihydroorotate dehydrogenase electron transfer subunit [Nitrospirota bacterium]